MLNYLSAELWRMRCRRLDLAQWMIFLLLAALAGWFCGTGSPAEALEAFQNLLPAGLYAALPLTSWAEGDAARTGLLTNEIVFGLPRGRIYLGKLFAAFLMGLLLFLFTALAFLGVALPLAAQDGWGPWEGDPVLALAVWIQLLEAVLCALPRYFGAAALAHLLLFSLRSAGLGAVLYYLYFFFGEMTLAAVSFQGMGLVGTALNTLGDLLRPFLLSGPYFMDMPPAEVGQSWTVGAVWVAGASALGLALFRRREIR